MCSGNCECNSKIIMENQQIIYNKLKEIEAKECTCKCVCKCPWTTEDMHYVQEQVLKAVLEVANHDIKIVRILESMGGVVEPANEETIIEPVATMEKQVVEVKTTKKRGVVK